MLHHLIEVAQAARRFNSVRDDHDHASSGIRSQISSRTHDRIEERSSTLRFTKHGDRMLETKNVARQWLDQVAVGFDRVDRRFIFWPQHLPEETNCRLLFKLSRRIKAATVIKQHRESNA